MNRDELLGLLALLRHLAPGELKALIVHLPRGACVNDKAPWRAPDDQSLYVGVLEALEACGAVDEHLFRQLRSYKHVPNAEVDEVGRSFGLGAPGPWVVDLLVRPANHAHWFRTARRRWRCPVGACLEGLDLDEAVRRATEIERNGGLTRVRSVDGSIHWDRRVALPIGSFTLDKITGLWWGTTPVTQSAWTAVLGDHASSSAGANKPVDQLGIEDAEAFVAAASHRLQATVRLPTEDEWQRAAGPVPSVRRLHGAAWYECAGLHPVKLKRPTHSGIYGLFGNVWEWVTTPTGAALRGGAFDSTAAQLYAGHEGPTDRKPGVGMRIVAESLPRRGSDA